MARPARPERSRSALTLRQLSRFCYSIKPDKVFGTHSGLELVEIWVENPNEYAAAFGVMRGAGVEALVLVPTPEINRDTEQLGELAAKPGLPTIGGHRESAQRGLLIGYGPSLRELQQQVAGYVERILNGAQAGELPFQGPTRLDFVINMRTAKTLGLTIPPSLLVGADEVIE